MSSYTPHRSQASASSYTSQQQQVGDYYYHGTQPQDGKSPASSSRGSRAAPQGSGDSGKRTKRRVKPGPWYCCYCRNGPMSWELEASCWNCDHLNCVKYNNPGYSGCTVVPKK